jgi:hypothetical protein
MHFTFDDIKVEELSESVLSNMREKRSSLIIKMPSPATSASET